MPDSEGNNYKNQSSYYDAICESQGKDYKNESKQLHLLIEKYKRSSGKNLLDIACGTGGHLSYLKDWYHAEGLDLDKQMLKIAKHKLPVLRFHQGNMVSFRLKRRFDVITCLFSSIGYTKSPDNLVAAIKNMWKHLKVGGVLILEPWFDPNAWNSKHLNKIHSIFVDKPKIKVARLYIGKRIRNISKINFHFLVCTPNGIKSFSELHEMGLFTKKQYLEALTNQGFSTIIDPKGITGRGLFICVKTTIDNPNIEV